jgi:hypothetical protein
VLRLNIDLVVNNTDIIVLAVIAVIVVAAVVTIVGFFRGK